MSSPQIMRIFGFFWAASACDENVTLTRLNKVRNFLTEEVERFMWVGKIAKLQIGSRRNSQTFYARKCFIKILVVFNF
jgi:hypothetical protein